jgi:hypothetical protein
MDIREYSTSTIVSPVTTGSFSLPLSSIIGSKIGKVVKINGVVAESIITSINTSTKSITISNSTTDVISSGSVASIYYNKNILITKQQWQNLEDDINKISLHQTNSSFAGYGTITGKVTVGNLSDLNTVIDNLTLTRNAVDATQLTLDPYLAEQVVPYSWGRGNAGIKSTVGAVFNSAIEMQSFFNSGGEISFGGVGPTLSTAQDTAWFNLLHNVFVNTSAKFTRSEFARIGPIPFQWYQVQDGNLPYNLNTITITAQKFTNYISFVITFRDGHVPIGGSPEDYVSSGAGFRVYQKRATGAFTGVQIADLTVSNFYTV